jgi:hypothetical protein
MRKTVASKEQGARSKERRAKSEERRAKSEEQGDLRNEKRRTPNPPSQTTARQASNVQRRSQYAAAAKVTGDPEVCAMARAAKR